MNHGKIVPKYEGMPEKKADVYTDSSTEFSAFLFASLNLRAGAHAHYCIIPVNSADFSYCLD
jgi:hypothetical protein